MNVDETPSFKSTLIPHQLNDEHDVLASFIDVVTDYCETLKNASHYDSIMLYYGITGDPQTLQQIGLLHAVSRERIRQVQNIHLYKIRQIFRGFVISGLKCDFVIRQDLNNLRDRFLARRVLTDPLIEKILLEEKITLTDNRKGHLRLFFNAFEIEPLFFLGMTLYFTRKKEMNLKKLKRAYDKTKQYLLENFGRPVSLKVLERDINASADLLKVVAPLDPSVEEIGTEEYQIKNTELSSFDVAYRVLLKEESMNMTDLVNTVNDLRGKRVEKIMLSMDDRFKCIGKTSRWTLAETDMNSDCYYQLVEKTLRVFNRPCSFREIFTYIQKELRPDVEFNNIFGTVHVYLGKKFFTLKDSRVILKEWKSKYKTELRKPNKKNKENFASILIRVLQGRAMYGRELTEEIQKYRKISRSTCDQGFSMSPILNKEKDGNKNLYSLKPNYEEILNDSRKLDIRRTVAEFILDLFEKEKKSKLNRSYIVDQVMQNLQVSKPFIYKYLRDSTDVFQIDLKNKKESPISLKKL
jgi:hypothetical protein